ncbi:MAG: hypothetical protein OEW39_07120 [Deltaproteobacteria bacterium]|nr:hypothetical protein [Deltaproteobacteria bacterium]
MNCALATDSSPARHPREIALLGAALLALLLATVGCSGSSVNSPEKTVLATRQGESQIQVTESEEGGNQLIRIKMMYQGEENTIVLNIDQPVYDVEIPLTMETVMPKAAKSEARGPEGQFQDLLIAQYLEKAQEQMMAGDYNGALRQVNMVLLTRPDHIQGHTMKGSVYYALGNYQLANEEWEYVLSLDPSNQEVQNFKEFLKNRQGKQQPPLPGAPKTPPGGAPPGGTVPAQPGAPK